MIPRDLSGRPVAFGRTRQERTFQFWGGTLPAGLEVVGTAAYTSEAVGPPAATVTTAATNAATARIRTAVDMDASKLRAIWFHADGVRVNTAESCTLYLALSSIASPASHGVLVVDDTFSDTRQIRGLDAAGVSTAYNLPFEFRTTKPKDIGMVLRPQDKIVHVFEGDQEIYQQSIPTYVPGLVRAQLIVQTRVDVARSVTVNQMRIAIEHTL
jgi:hypothetical protein